MAKIILGETKNIPVKLCRGARDIALKLFKGMGFIDAATDEAWNKKCDELGIK